MKQYKHTPRKLMPMRKFLKKRPKTPTLQDDYESILEGGTLEEIKLKRMLMRERGEM